MRRLLNAPTIVTAILIPFVIIMFISSGLATKTYHGLFGRTITEVGVAIDGHNPIDCPLVPILRQIETAHPDARFLVTDGSDKGIKWRAKARTWTAKPDGAPSPNFADLMTSPRWTDAQVVYILTGQSAYEILRTLGNDPRWPNGQTYLFESEPDLDSVPSGPPTTWSILRPQCQSPT